MKYLQAFFMSLGMFSSIPCPYRPWNERARHMMLAFLPLVGLVIGALWYGLYFILNLLNLPFPLQAAALMIYPYLITGFIHLDGFMDTSDALLSRRPLQEKLRILKDPHTGAFAVISVVVLMVLCYASMSSVVERIHLRQALDMETGGLMLSLIFIPVITRCGSALAVMAGKPLAHSQYHAEEGQKKPAAEIAAVAIIAILVFSIVFTLGAGLWQIKTDYSLFIVLVCTAAAYVIAVVSSARQLAGVSGDLAGYALTWAEAVALVVLACVV